MARRSNLILALFLAACSGGGGGDDSGGTGGTGISQGPVTGIGSFHVTGTRWTLGSGGAVDLDGAPGTENDLRLGMVVTVEGERSADGLTGTATRVVYDDEIEGPIDSLMAFTDETVFSVFGRMFVADRSTVYDDVATFDSFQTAPLDTVVEVSGVPDFHPPLGNVIRATRIEVRSAPLSPGNTEVEIRDVAANYMAGGTLEIGSVTVQLNDPSCGGLPILDPPLLDLGAQPLVEVRGRYLGLLEICAERIELEDDLTDSENFELEGFVTNATSNDSFVVGDVTVDGSRAAFEPADLVVAIGMKLDVEGDLTGGVLVAREVAQRGSARIKAEVTDTPTGSIVLLGRTISTNTGTEFEPGVPAIGNFVLLRAVEDGSGRLTAIHVKVETPDRVELRARVESIDRANRSLTILGIAIGTNSGPGGTVYRALDGATLTAAEFFDDPGTRVEIGDVIEARDCIVSDLTAFDDPACELEFED